MWNQGDSPFTHRVEGKGRNDEWAQIQVWPFLSFFYSLFCTCPECKIIVKFNTCE